MRGKTQYRDYQELTKELRNVNEAIERIQGELERRGVGTKTDGPIDVTSPTERRIDTGESKRRTATLKAELKILKDQKEVLSGIVTEAEKSTFLGNETVKTGEKDLSNKKKLKKAIEQIVESQLALNERQQAQLTRTRALITADNFYRMSVEKRNKLTKEQIKEYDILIAQQTEITGLTKDQLFEQAESNEAFEEIIENMDTLGRRFDRV